MRCQGDGRTYTAPAAVCNSKSCAPVSLISFHELAVADGDASGGWLNEPRFTGMASVFELLQGPICTSKGRQCYHVQQIVLRYYRTSVLKLKRLPVWSGFVIQNRPQVGPVGAAGRGDSISFTS